ncbi:hypothetical protein QSV55_07075 [Macrococcus bovicus]|nr:hypothetical protein QSV55_07075 [Macrococcus bovicus]
MFKTIETGIVHYNEREGKKVIRYFGGTTGCMFSIIASIILTIILNLILNFIF